MRKSTKIVSLILGALLFSMLSIAFLVSSYLSTTLITVDNASGYALTDIKIDIEGKTLSDVNIGIHHIITYKIKNQNEGSIKFEATLNNQKISKEFGYVTHNMREEFLIHVLSSDDIRIHGH